MLPTNPICAVCDYGTSAVYRDLPSEEQRRSGVVPLDSLPAAWWNCMWYDINRSMNQARNAVGSLINELDTVLTQAGICACDTCVNQLYQAIEVLRRTIGDSTTPGAVKSSSTPGQVSIDNNGIMTANCVGNANNLTTTAHTLVGAINELKQVYDCCISDLKTCDTALNTNKAPNNHASAATTYGVGNASNYGHVRLSDTYNTCVGAAADGIAASQKALYDMYTAITSTGYVCLGNTAGCALGTASAGSCGTAARSDHVHPMPNYVASAGNADTVDGYHANVSNYGGNVVVRDSSGYIYTSRVNMDVGNENIASYGDPVLIFSGGNEKWLRRTPVGNVSVGYASSAGSAGSAGTADKSAHLLINGTTWDSNWHWSGQSGQPTWLWGSNNGVNMYVWNPSNFSVAYAGSAGVASNIYNSDGTAAYRIYISGV